MVAEDYTKNIIEIRNVGFKSEIERGNIKVFSETSDGINIELQNGMQLFHTNYNMPQETKRSIVNGFNTFKKAKRLIIDYSNFKKPITIMAQ